MKTRSLTNILISDNKGVMGLKFILALSTLTVTIGSAVDMLRLIDVSQNLQAATDSSALHAALIWRENEQADLTVESKHIFDLNLEDTANVTVINYDAVINDTSIVVSATADIQSEFMKLFGYKRLGASVTSAVSLDTNTTAPPCIITLADNKTPGFLSNSGAGIHAQGCEVHVHSVANPATIFNSGITHDVARTCIAGSNIIDNNGTIANIETACEVAEDPYLDAFPIPNSSTCDYSHGNFNGGIVDLYPGTYCGWFNFNNSSADVTFHPGLYLSLIHISEPTRPY